MFPIERPRRSVRCQTVPPSVGMTTTHPHRTPCSGARSLQKLLPATPIYIANSTDTSGRAPIHVSDEHRRYVRTYSMERGPRILPIGDAGGGHVAEAVAR
jgi:hypothetical protein